jgi:hypothetical protein
MAGDLIERLSKIQAATDILFTNLAARPKQDSLDVKAFRESLVFVAGLVSVAGQLMDPSFPVNPQVRETVNKELELIKTADTIATSPLSGRMLDYSRFKALGKYAGNPIAARFYRSVRFLQDIKFHVESEKETLAGMILYVYGDFGGFTRYVYPGFGSFYSEVFGKEDDIDSRNYSMAFFHELSDEYFGANRAKTDPVRLVRFIKAAQENLRKLPPPRINDEALDRDEFRDWQKKTKAMRLVCPAYLPDSELICRSVEPNLPKRQFPSGLDIGVMLGSRRATELLTALETTAVAEHVQDCAKRITRDDSAIYSRFLRILEDYRAEMERNSKLQAVFQRPAWNDKTLNTLLCGWSFIRHSACLAGKDSAYWLCASVTEFAGYVEPTPQFYLALAGLLAGYEKVLCAKCEPSLKIRAMEIMDFSAQFKVSGTNSIELFIGGNNQYLDLANTLWPPSFRMTMEEERVQDLKRYAGAAERYLAGKPNTEEQNLPCFEQIVTNNNGEKVITMQSVFSSSRLDGLSDEDILKHTLPPKDNEFAEYRLLMRLCIRLASIALKETQNIPLNEEDTEFIKHYGGMLGNACFYDGNSYLHPRDDMPIAVPVYSNLELKKLLMAGIGRAKSMKIIIRDPQTGKDMVCTGGITLYHEYTSGTRLSDNEWRAELLKPAGPKPVPWMVRYLAPLETAKDRP